MKLGIFLMAFFIVALGGVIIYLIDRKGGK